MKVPLFKPYLGEEELIALKEIFLDRIERYILWIALNDIFFWIGLNDIFSDWIECYIF